MVGFTLTRDPAGIRTQDPYIKSVMLYRLSYGILLFARKLLFFIKINVYLQGCKYKWLIFFLKIFFINIFSSFFL